MGERKISAVLNLLNDEQWPAVKTALNELLKQQEAGPTLNPPARIDLGETHAPGDYRAAEEELEALEMGNAKQGRQS